MKTYKLITIEGEREIGRLLVEENYKKITINLSPFFKKDYKPALITLIQSIKSRESRFQRVLISGDVVLNSNEDFLVALIQYLFLHLRIIAEKDE